MQLTTVTSMASRFVQKTNMSERDNPWKREISTINGAKYYADGHKRQASAVTGQSICRRIVNHRSSYLMAFRRTFETV